MAAVGDTISVRSALKADLEEEARLSNQSTTQVAEAAIAGYLAGRKRKREAVRQALEEARRGVFVSETEVFRWVESWGTADELPTPEPDVFTRR
ncbi:hypothetical protein [Aurantimonas sp. VKM B-3413]|uniref:hypothetical protein n=1 Tax=Aurantimonas sp. VKM B-3413 TaxID=2779401 RepID=UPI001E4DB0A1|nr:hypothetical protein [Aurantimonas sp. VKM B-3413]MCB8837274.1 hypothetical protein [Aurantimonas sp. VKM B-3413]